MITLNRTVFGLWSLVQGGLLHWTFSHDRFLHLIRFSCHFYIVSQCISLSFMNSSMMSDLERYHICYVCFCYCLQFYSILLPSTIPPTNHIGRYKNMTVQLKDKKNTTINLHPLFFSLFHSVERPAIKPYFTRHLLGQYIFTHYISCYNNWFVPPSHRTIGKPIQW